MEFGAVINPILGYIDEHLQEQLTVEKIAKRAGYSEYHFARIFKRHMQVTVMEYVNRRRLIKASEEILAGSKIIDAALKYGWQSHSGFTKAFKREFGFYPALLRAMLAELEYLGGSVMSHVFLKAVDEHKTKEQLFDILKDQIQKNGIEINQEEFKQIYQCACKAYEGIKRYSGDEYITHLLQVAIILTELNAEADVICAGLFCDVAKKGNISLEELSAELPGQIMEIVERVSKFDDQPAAEMEDVVIIIKLAERLHNMRTVGFMEESRQRRKAQETIEIFMPMARRLGNQKLMDELMNLSLAVQ